MDPVEIPNSNEIKVFFHCGRCIQERPHDQSPREWGALEVGWTVIGLQVWCKRHDVNVAHIHFEGCRHPANIARSKT